jgi:hypothetical protein
MSYQSCSIGLENGTSISSLGMQVSLLSSQIHAYLDKTSCPQPTLEASGGDVPEDSEYNALRASLNDVALDLLYLVNGPKTSIRDFIFSHNELAAMQVALDRGFFRHIPLPSNPINHGAGRESSLSVTEIAAKADMDEARTGAILKLLASRRIFKQVKQGDSEAEHFTHTAMSAHLARDPGLHAMGHVQLGDTFKASSELSAIVSDSPHTSSSAHTAFRRRHGIPPFQYYEQNPDKGKYFAEAMGGWPKSESRLLHKFLYLSGCLPIPLACSRWKGYGAS